MRIFPAVKRGDLQVVDGLTFSVSSQVKVIDFGSTCFEGNTFFSYIQSRHYRAPEVILGLPYTGAIDMWSFGCVIAELLVGIPIFPGENEFNQLAKIIEMVGMPPTEMLDRGSKTKKFFRREELPTGEHRYVLRDPAEFCEENNIPFAENRRYHSLHTIEELAQRVVFHRGGLRKSNDAEFRKTLCDFLSRIFVIDPNRRMTVDEAIHHKFLESKFHAADFSTVNLVPTSNFRMEELVVHIFNHRSSLKLIQAQTFSTERYYQTYMKAVERGCILNVLHGNPFYYKPFATGVVLPDHMEDSQSDDDELPSIGVFTGVPPRSRSKSLSLDEDPPYQRFLTCQSSFAESGNVLRPPTHSLQQRLSPHRIFDRNTAFLHSGL